jgi:hypothetical protein
MSKDNDLKTLITELPSYKKLRGLGLTHDHILALMLQSEQLKILDAFDAAHKTTNGVGDL